MGVSAQVFECEFSIVEGLSVVLLVISYTNESVNVVSVKEGGGLWPHLEGLLRNVHEHSLVGLALLLENHMILGVVLYLD